MSFAEKPNVLERVGASLTDHVDVELIGALAYAQINPNAEERPRLTLVQLEAVEPMEFDPRTELGSQLVRLKLGGDASVAQRTALLLERWVRHQRAFRSWKLRPGREDLVTRFVQQSLDEWLFETCTECHGRQLVGLDRGEIVERRIRCTRCSGRGWLQEVPRYSDKARSKIGSPVLRDCNACGGRRWRTHAKVRQRKTEQCGKCKGTGQRIASAAERAMSLGVDVRVYEKHWEKKFSWLAGGLDRLNHIVKRCLQSQLRAGISRA